MMVLKQSTSVVISFGPFLDKTDGVTLETGLVSALDNGTTGIMLSKNGGTLAVRNAAVTATTYDAHGCYKVTLDTTDTGTLGQLRVIYTDAATCLPVWRDYLVVPANIYDSMASGSDLLDVSAAQFAGQTITCAGGVTVPAATLASTTNITAGTITTATNLTNERAKYMHGCVWIGPTANTNTVNYTDGIMTNPVSTIAAAKTIADSLGLKRFWIQAGVTVSLAADYGGYVFDGIGWTLATTGLRSVSGAVIRNAFVSGTFSGASAPYFENCEFNGAATIPACNAHHCEFGSSTITLGTGNYDFVDCASVVAGTGTPVFDCGLPSSALRLSFRRWSGGLTFNNINSNVTISVDVVSGGTITLNGSDGNVQIRGNVAGITDNRTGTPTLGQNAAINITEIADGVLTRDMSAVTGEATRSPLNALRKLMNRWKVVGGTLTVYKEDDTASAFTQTVTTGAVDPITEVNTD
jgi:hypothetical protein